MPLKPGDRIERYVIDGLLGSGGMGEVYRAHDSRLKRAVALKILHAEEAADASKSSSPSSNGAARMMREAQLAAALDHPNVVAVFDVGQIDQPEALRGTTYLAMELIKGEPLRKYVGDPGVKMKVRVRWLEEIARALGAAHAAGLVHRDVKPENVMIRDDGIVKVLDFGIAKRTVAAPIDPSSSTEGFAVPTMTKEGVIVGTPFYMAPEQLRGESLDGRVDQFAWGVLAYELLAGKRLWSMEGGGYALVAQILQAPAASLSEVAGLPAKVAAVVARALAKDPADRFPTMAALLEDLVGKAEGGDSEAKVPLSPSLPDGEEVSAAEAPTQASGKVVDGAESSAPLAQGLALHPTERLVTTEVPAPRPARPRLVGVTVGLALAVAAITSAVYVVKGPGRRGPAAATSAAPSAAPAAGCTSNRACVEAHGGEAWVCRPSDHACVAIGSEDCKAFHEPSDLLAEDTVWVGALFPTRGADAADGAMHVNGIALARKEIADSTEALEGTSAARRVRRLGLVACDDSGDAMRAVRHLVDDVGVPAIVGFSSGNEVVQVAGGFLIGRGVLSIATNTADSRITRLPQAEGGARLVWRTTYGSDAIGHAAARIVHDVLEPRAARGVVRVALLREESPGALAFADAFLRDLVFNSKSAVANGNRYQEFGCGRTPSTEEIRSLASRLNEFQPTFVVLAAVTETASVPIVTALEGVWPRGQPRPTYLVTNDSTEGFAPLIGRSAESRHRFFGLVSPSNTPANARFVLKYNATYKDQVTREVNSSFSYDAFYLLAYATYALGSHAVSGAGLADGLGRLVPPGRIVNAGPTDLIEGISSLAKGERIDFQGVSGDLDFDVARGDAPTDFALSCPDVDAQGRAKGNVETDLFYRAKTGRVEGTMSCP